jgi:hypothetical protein
MLPAVFAKEHGVRRHPSRCWDPILKSAWHPPDIDMAHTIESPLITDIVCFASTLCYPDYPLSKTTTNLIVAEPFDAVLANSFVTHQRIKLIFQ